MPERDVVPLLKAKQDCPCGCGAFGSLTRPFSDGTQHVKGCNKAVCARCRGRNSKRKGGKGQRRAQRLLAVPRASSIATGHEELAAGTVRFEVKSGAQVRPMRTAFAKAEAQSDNEKRIGDHRPFVMAALEQADGKEMIVAFRVRTEDDMRNTVYALAVQLGLIES